MTPPPDDNPNTKPAEAGGESSNDPFDKLLAGGGDSLSLDSASALSEKISGGLSGAGDVSSAIADASKLTEALTAGVAPPASDSVEHGSAVVEPPLPPGGQTETAVQEEGKEDEETKTSKARAAAGKVNSFLKSKKDTWSDYALVFTGWWKSSDRLTARMSVVFVFCFIGMIYVVNTAWHRHSKTMQEIRRRELLMRTAQSEELAKKLADEEKLRSSIVTMGKFTLELNPIEGQKLTHGVVNMAEVEIVLLCDSKATREYVETHYTYARSLLVTALVSMDREELLSHDGKKKWKAILMKVLNHWLKEGQIMDLYFARLIVN